MRRIKIVNLNINLHFSFYSDNHRVAVRIPEVLIKINILMYYLIIIIIDDKCLYFILLLLFLKEFWWRFRRKGWRYSVYSDFRIFEVNHRQFVSDQIILYTFWQSLMVLKKLNNHIFYVTEMKIQKKMSLVR